VGQNPFGSKRLGPEEVVGGREVAAIDQWLLAKAGYWPDDFK
jgi:hypothetical protein